MSHHRCWELLFLMGDQAFHIVRTVTDFRMLVKACVSGDTKMYTAVDVMASSFLLAFHVLVLGPRTMIASEAVLFFGDMLLHFFHMLLSSWQLSHYLWTARKREAHQFFLFWTSFILHTAMVWHYSGGIQVSIRVQIGGDQEDNAPPPQPPGAPPAPNPDAIVAAIVAARATAQAAEAAAARDQPPENNSGRSPGNIAGQARSTSPVEVPPDAHGELGSTARTTPHPTIPVPASRLDSARNPEGAPPALSEDQQRLSPQSESELSHPDCIIADLPSSGSSTFPGTSPSLSSPPVVPFQDGPLRDRTPSSEGFEDLEYGEHPVGENRAFLPTRSPGLSSASTLEARANGVTGATPATAQSKVQQDGQSSTTTGNSSKPAPDTSPERAEQKKSPDGSALAVNSRRGFNQPISQCTHPRPPSGIDRDAAYDNGETWPNLPFHSGPRDITCPSSGFSPPSYEGHNGDALQASQRRELPLTRSTDTPRRPFDVTPEESAQSSGNSSINTNPKPSTS